MSEENYRFKWRDGRVLLGVVVAIVAVLMFLFSIQLLSAATGFLSPELRLEIEGLVRGDFPALGASWLATYVLLNGSVVAAIALSLFDSGLIAGTQLFLMVAGSRLGAAGIVVLIGGFDFLQKRRYSLQRATSLGLLTFVVTHTIYVPATVLGYIAIRLFDLDVGGLDLLVDVRIRWFEFFAPLASSLTELVGAPVALGFALLLILTSMRLFDRLFASVQTEWLRDRIFIPLGNPSISFLLGLLITGLTTSVAFSLGVIVPLYNRGYVDRSEIVPYILGASLGTLTDTLFVAVALGSSVGIEIVLLVLGSAMTTTAVAFLFYRRYFVWISTIHDRIQTDFRTFVVVLSLLVIVPIVFIFIPF